MGKAQFQSQGASEPALCLEMVPRADKIRLFQVDPKEIMLSVHFNDATVYS